jgi:NAD(P)-dependent dehydrogenase (short-subunit alcohol dehydrogenase family)
MGEAHARSLPSGYAARRMASNRSGAVVVTGASTGIGRATALDLDRAGYRVFAGIRKQEDAKSLEEEATGELTPIALDVAKEDSIEAAKTTVQDAVGEDGLAGLVNNAGVGGGGPIEYMDIDDFRNTIEVNLVGQVAVTQAFLPLIRKGKGTIVFIASIGGRIASPFMSPYNASKFGIEAVGESLRREVAPWGIDVVLVEPGSIATEIWAKGNETMRERVGGLPDSARKLYGAQFSRFGELLKETADRGIPPEKVAKVVRKAIRSNRPKHHYLVGTDAKMGARINAILPGRAMDAMLRRQTKFPKRLEAE